MADNRNRIYYPDAQVTKNLFTNGGEWMLLDGTEYVGSYHTYTTGEVFTRSSYVDQLSCKLIPYTTQEQTQIKELNGINILNSFDYDEIKSIDVTIGTYPVPHRVYATDSDFVRGYVNRFFARKVNEELFIEISEEDYGNTDSPDGISSLLWHTFSIRWKVSGPARDVYKNGNIEIPGIIDTNLRSIQDTQIKYSGFENVLTDPSQYSKI
jgi:hypothetical protein